jgi:hypothetical protein
MSKRALIVGINQFATGVSSLRGCVNDTQEMNALLTKYFGFKDIKILTDGDATQNGIRQGLAWLLSDYERGGKDVRVFHFSSHGTQVPDEGDDEWDYVDEAIVPHDHDWDNAFRDDDLRVIFEGIPDDVNFTFIADCCHSGTIQKKMFEVAIEWAPRQLEPPRAVQKQLAESRKKAQKGFDAWAAAHLADMLKDVPPDQWPVKMQEFMALLRKAWEENRYGFVNVANHILLAGCEDRQTAADAHIAGEWRGAFTWALSKAIKEANGDLTYEQLVGNAGTNLSNYSQKPQLECSTDKQTMKIFAPFA